MRQWFGEEWRYFLVAMTLLTRLPTPRLKHFEEGWLPRSTAYYPLIGLIVGLIAAGAYSLATLVWPAPVAAFFAIMAATWVTGGLHEDGWADVFDALGAGGDREHMLAVMKDSRIGATGALALILLVGGKLIALAGLPMEDAPRVLVVVHALSRWAILPLLWRLRHARPTGGLAGPLAGRVTLGRVTAGTVLAALIAASFLGWRALLPSFIAVGLVTSAGFYFHVRLGGITGDCLGATHQLVELLALLVLAADWSVLR